MIITDTSFDKGDERFGNYSSLVSRSDLEITLTMVSVIGECFGGIGDVL